MVKEERRFTGSYWDEYDLIRHGWPHYDQFQAQIIQELKEHIDNNMSDKDHIQILEIGCADGATTRLAMDYIYQNFENKKGRFELFALDNEPNMIQQAREFFREKYFPKETAKDEYYLHPKRGISYIFTDKRTESIKSLVIVQNDALNYLVNNRNCFDAIITGFTYHNFFPNEYRNETIEATYNALKQGGIFVNGDKIAQNDPDAHMSDFIRHVHLLEVYAKMGRPDIRDAYLKHQIEDNDSTMILKEGEYITKLKEVGFNDVKLVYRNHMETVITGVKKNG